MADSARLLAPRERGEGGRRPGEGSWLTYSPAPLTPIERAIAIILTVLVALSRLATRAASPWDWDEALFCTAMRKYDVVLHHPHPPGFPLFVLSAKVLRFFTHTDFRAVQGVTLLASMLLFPAIFFLARELRWNFAAACGAGLLYVFFPNVWFYGGTGFSDVPATLLVIIAATLLLRGCRSRRDFLLGALVLGIAIGFRTQNAGVGFVPLLLATIQRAADRLREIVIAALMIVVIVAASYGGAALLSSSVDGYLEVSRSVGTWVHNVDSFHNPSRPPLPSLMKRYFVGPVNAGRIDWIVFALAVISIVTAPWRRRWGVLVALLIFLPFAVLAWLLLDIWSVGRYAVAYLPLYALLAADGTSAIASVLPRVARVAAQAAIVVAIVARYALWFAPALPVVRSESPTAGAMRYILEHTKPGDPVVAHGSVGPFTGYYLADRHVREPGLQNPIGALYTTEGRTMSEGAVVFSRPHERLWGIVRQRYFDVSVEPASNIAAFGVGWYDREGGGEESWRWMGGRSVAQFPPIRGRARLTLHFELPATVTEKRPAHITISLNGKSVDVQTYTTTMVDRMLEVNARDDASNELVIETDHVLNPLKEHLTPDGRDLGLRLRSYSWTQVSS